MRSRQIHVAFTLLWLFAYALNSNALPWSLVRCEEPGGQVAIEFAGDHNRCSARLAPVHGHDQARLSSTTCDNCSACPCNDTPVGAAPAAPGENSLRLARCTGAGPCSPPPACASMVGLDRGALPIVQGHAAQRRDRVTQRCLGSVMLLV